MLLIHGHESCQHAYDEKKANFPVRQIFLTHCLCCLKFNPQPRSIPSSNQLTSQGSKSHKKIFCKNSTSLDPLSTTPKYRCHTPLYEKNYFAIETYLMAHFFRLTEQSNFKKDTIGLKPIVPMELTLYYPEMTYK